MKYFGEELSGLHKELSGAIRKKGSHEYAVRLFISLHEKLHLSEESNGEPNGADMLFGGMQPDEYRIMPTSKDETIAWAVWHIARIEDLTMNILVGCADQIFDSCWKAKMNASISDTGNALNDDEIMRLSNDLDIAALLAYRSAVGKRTREIAGNLSEGDMTRKISSESLEKIRSEGGVTDQEESVWLLDYWGGKDVAGILLMPPTRHLMMHLNDCCKWKRHIRDGRKCFREG